jgi:glycosyltransferase involved in cell wall biosynthesis
MLAEPTEARLLMVLESVYPTTGGGGAENQVRTLCAHFSRKGRQVRIVVPMSPGGSMSEWDRIDGTRLRRIPYPRIRLLGGIFLNMRLAWHLVSHRREYDVIHAHIAHNMAATCSIVGRLLGKKVIIKFTGWMELEAGVLASSRRGPMEFIRRFALRRANYVQATSTAIRKRLMEHGFRSDRIHVIPNAVDTQRFHPRDSEHSQPRSGEEKERLTAIYTGRLVPVKSLQLLLEAWFLAFPADAPVALIMIGEGELHPVLEQYISVHGREGQVRLLGAKANVEQYLQQADFGVLVSIHEGLSNALLEYMAAGLPVLGTRISGNEDLIREDVTGWLVPPGEMSAVRNALSAILQTDPSKIERMGEAAREAVSQYAAIEVVTELLELLYQPGQLASSPRGSRTT